MCNYRHSSQTRRSMITLSSLSVFFFVDHVWNVQSIWSLFERMFLASGVVRRVVFFENGVCVRVCCNPPSR